MKLPSVQKIGSEHIILAAILLLAGILRFYAISFGAPFKYHPDEVKLVVQAGHFLNTRFIDPNVYFMGGIYPVLFTLVLAVLMGIYIFFVLLTGRLEGFSQAAQYYQDHSFEFFLVGRYFVAILGVLSVFVLYLIVKKLFKSNRLALVSAALLAVNFVHVRNSHFCTVDVPATFLALLAIYYAAKVLQHPSTFNYFLSALLTAAAIGAKYSLFPTALPLIYAHIYHAWGKPFDFKKLFNLKAVTAIVTAIAGFFIFCPMFIIDFQRTMARLFRYQAFEKIGKIGSGGSFLSYWTGDQSPGFGMFYPNSIPTTFGVFLTILILVGIGIQLYRHKKQDIFLLIFVLPMYFYFDHLAYKAMRHILPIIPILLVSGAVALVWLSENLFKNPVLKFSALAGLLLGLVISGTVSSMNYLDEIQKTDPRTDATTWIEQNIPAGSRIAVEAFPPDIPGLYEENVENGYEITRLELQSKQESLADSLINRFEEKEFDYYIADGFTRQWLSWKYTREKYAKVVKDRYQLFQWLDTDATIAAEFRPDNEQIQPFIIIYTFINE